MHHAALPAFALAATTLALVAHAGEDVTGIPKQFVVEAHRDDDGWLHVRVSDDYPHTERVIVPLTPDAPTEFGYFVFVSPEGRRADFPRAASATGSLFRDTFVFGRTVPRSRKELKLDRFQASPLQHKTQWYIADRVSGDLYEISCTYTTTRRLERGYERSDYDPAATLAYYVTDLTPGHAAEAVVCEGGGAILFGAEMPRTTDPFYRAFTRTGAGFTWSKDRFGAYAPHHLGQAHAVTDVDRATQARKDALYAAAREREAQRLAVEQAERARWELLWPAGTYCLLWAGERNGFEDAASGSFHVQLMDLTLTSDLSPVSFADDVRRDRHSRLAGAPSFIPAKPASDIANNPFAASSLQPGSCDASEESARSKGFSVQRTAVRY